ncbi:MAG: hypothetical protein ACI8PZ_005049 [Myxococcota bacterium]
MRWLLPLLMLGCASETGGRRIGFTAEVAPILQPVDGVLRWTDASTGTEITLTEARAWVGPITLWSDAPLLQVGSAWRALDWVVPSAWAGVDHFEAGFVTGEVLDQVEVDLVAGEVVPMGDGIGLAGPSLSGEIWLEPVSGDATITLVGEADAGAGPIPFRLDLTLDGDWFDVEAGENPILQRRIRGLPWDARLSRGGTLRVEVDPSRWLVGADFEALRSESPDGLILPGTKLGDRVRQQVRQVGGDRAWELTWTP